MKLIGLSGKKFSGKNTVAAMIRKNTKRPCVEVAFATALKEEVARATGTSVSYIESHKDNFRLILQGWGTDYRRKLSGELYWIEKLLVNINRHPRSSEPDSIFIVTDVRFPNEAEALADCGAIMVRVDRGTSDDTHPSETALDHWDFDHVIQNFGSLQNLESQVKQLMLDIL